MPRQVVTNPTSLRYLPLGVAQPSSGGGNCEAAAVAAHTAWPKYSLAMLQAAVLPTIEAMVEMLSVGGDGEPRAVAVELGEAPSPRVQPKSPSRRWWRRQGQRQP